MILDDCFNSSECFFGLESMHTTNQNGIRLVFKDIIMPPSWYVWTGPYRGGCLLHTISAILRADLMKTAVNLLLVQNRCSSFCTNVKAEVPDGSSCNQSISMLPSL